MGQLIRQDCATEILPPEPQWRRNGYWLPITTPTDSEEKAVILKAVFDSTQEWTALSVTGDYTVDWGDGNIEPFASGVIAEHTYNYADADLHDSSATLGHKQAIIQIYPQNGQQLTSLNLHVRHSAAGGAVYESGFLDVAIAGGNLTSILFGNSNQIAVSNLIRHDTVERFYLGINNSTDLSFICCEMRNLVKISRFYCNNALNLSYAFYLCLSLDVRSLNGIITTNCQYFSHMFQNVLHKNSPYFETPEALDMSFMYANCTNNEFIPKYITDNVLTLESFADTNIKLKNFPLLNTPLCENFNSIARFAYNLTEFPLLNTQSAKYINSMLELAIGLKELPNFNLPNLLTGNSAFSGTGGSLTYIPSFSLPACTSAITFFGRNKNKVKNVSVQDTWLIQNFSSFFQNWYSLENFGDLDCTSGTTFTNILAGCGNVSSGRLMNCRYTVSIANCKFPKENIEAFLAALGSAAAGTQTITISGNPGTGTIYSKTATTTAGSKTVIMADTSNLAIGDRMTGSGSPLTTAIAVTFTDAGDTVNLVNHQLPNGHPVSFPSITTTTGIVIRTIYYVVNATTDNFQLAATVGGAALALTSDGSGTMIYDAVIESIDPNVSVTLSAPATSNSTGSKSFRSLNTAPALLKGFTISG